MNRQRQIRGKLNKKGGSATPLGGSSPPSASASQSEHPSKRRGVPPLHSPTFSSDRKYRLSNKKGSILVFLVSVTVSMLMVVTTLCETASGLAARGMAESVTELAARSVLTNYHRSLQEQYGLFGCALDKVEMERQFSYYVDETLRTGADETRLVRLALESAGVDLTEHSFLNPDVLEHQILDYMKYRIVDALFEDNLLKEAETLACAEQALEKAEPVYEAYEQFVTQKEKLKSDWERWRRLNEKDTLSDQEYEQLVRLETKLEKKLSDMSRMREDTYKKISNFETWTAAAKKEKDCDLTAVEEMARSVGEIKEELQEMGDLSVHNLSFQSGEGNGAKERKKLKDMLSQIKKLFSPDDTSAQSTDLRTLRSSKTIQELPSVLHGSQGFRLPEVSGLTDLHGMLLKGRNNIYVNQYIREHFGSRVPKRENGTFFQNEMEYILFGNYSDAKNGSYARNQLFALRSAVNLIHVYSNSQKRTEAGLVAAALTPGPAIPVTRAILLTLWAAAEAGNDVKRLLAGEKVPFLKTEEDWQLDLDGVLASQAEDGPPKSAQKGLCYEDYLMLFLLVKNREDKLIRTMDLIQLNVRSSFDGSFQMKNCYGGMDVRGNFVKESGIYSGGSGWKRRGIVEQAHVY